jgi:3-deoxy-manno-octulosonate cytidylyltransferase (CMP-KDO synthetase)
MKALALFGKTIEKTQIEEIEDIEILRFLELGIDVKMVEVSDASIAVDYPDDILRVEKALRERSNEI